MLCLQHAQEGIYRDLWDKMISKEFPYNLKTSKEVWDLVANSEEKYAGLADDTFVQVILNFFLFQRPKFRIFKEAQQRSHLV